MPGLDGIRGIGVVVVMLFHAGQFHAGAAVIDAFFLLSGFLITGLLLGEREKYGSIGLGAFWARRVRRLLPALFFMLAGIALIALVWAEADELATIRKDGLATLGYVANWNAIYGSQDYWDLFKAPSPLEHTWSLAIEEQFYLIWPLLFVGVLTFTRGSVKILLTVCAGLAVASTAWMWYLYEPGQSVQRLYLGTDTRATAFLAGCGLACLLHWRGEVTSRRGRVVLETAAAFSLVAIALIWGFVDGNNPFVYRGGLFTHAALMLVLIAAVAHSSQGPSARFLSWRPFVLVGLISYGLYLWHLPVFIVLNEQRTGLSGWDLTAIRIAVSIAIATLSYLVIENPIRRGALRGWKIQAAVPAAALVLAGLLLVTTTGATSTTQLAFQEAEKTASGTDLGDAPLPSPGGDDEPRIMVVGDSVGVFLGITMKGQEDDLGIVSYNASQGGCTFTRGADTVRTPQVGGGELEEPAEHCADDWAEAAQEFRPDVVFAAFGGGGRVDPKIDGEFLVPCTPEHAAWYTENFSVAVDELAATGAHVMLTTTPYWLAGEFQGREDVESWLDNVINDRIDCIDALNAEIAASNPNLDLIDLREWVCPDGVCREEVDGVTLREDGVHYLDEAAALVNEWALPQLLAAIPDDPPTATGTS